MLKSTFAATFFLLPLLSHAASAVLTPPGKVTQFEVLSNGIRFRIESSPMQGQVPNPSECPYSASMHLDASTPNYQVFASALLSAKAMNSATVRAWVSGTECVDNYLPKVIGVFMEDHLYP